MRAKNKEQFMRPHVLGTHLGLEFGSGLNCYLDRRLIRPITRLVPLNGKSTAQYGQLMLEVRKG